MNCLYFLLLALTNLTLCICIGRSQKSGRQNIDLISLILNKFFFIRVCKISKNI